MSALKSKPVSAPPESGFLRLDRKAIHLPSGDHRGLPSAPALTMKRRAGCDPSAGADQIVECSGEKLAICCWTVNRIVRPSGEISASRMSFRRMMSAGVIGPPAAAVWQAPGRGDAAMRRTADAASSQDFITGSSRLSGRRCEA